MTRDLSSGWESVSVGDLCSVEYGKGLSKKLRIETGSADVYGSAGLVGHHDCALVEEPVIVIGRKGNAGSVWLTNGPSWPIDTTYFLRPPREISPEFLAWQLGSRDLVQKDSSTTIPSLRRPDLEATPVAVAPIGEQERIVAAIEEHFSRLDAVESVLVSNPKIEALRRSILREAFSGRLVSQNPNDEPASALLERIAASRRPA
ncbi:restriction endonuclease subunit S [Candidatus Poriferisocius sp.]|uniref:restriction endonuclease subunit S n=1 Tax=Candidatus Poriferisocius sp. TaxID=3101276 RepID=UPI003B015A6B